MPDLGDPAYAKSFDADTIAKALVNIYQKKYGNGTAPEPTLFEKTKEIFSNAVSKGWSLGGSPDRTSAFVDALRHNTEVFSAFRTHKMQSDIAAQLLDGKGQLKPFGKFLKDVKPYISHQNRAWLETEYNTAVLRAHQAADWKQFEAEKDVLPNLEWLPSTSPNPGADHQPYWGTVLPIDHEFWKNHKPGDRWNCKCSLRNTDKKPTSVPAETLVKNLQPSKGLESNPGTTGEIFSDKHPYFPENCGQCPFNKGVGKLIDLVAGKKKHCGDCKVAAEICGKGKTPFWAKEEKLRPYKVDNKDFEVLKKTWNIPFKNAKEMNESAIGGFNILRFEKVIIQILDFLDSKGVDINRTAKCVSSLYKDSSGNITLAYQRCGIRLMRTFILQGEDRVVKHLYFNSGVHSQGIGSVIMNEMLKQYQAMNVSKITLYASSDNGGYTWAKMGFWAEKRSEILAQINDTKKCSDKNIRDKMRQIVADYYQKTGRELPESLKKSLEHDHAHGE